MTEDRTPTGSSSPATRRRVRPGVVAIACLLAVAVAAAAVIWRQGDFWRASAANFLRERMAADYGAQFQTNELRGGWFPPRLSLGRLTVQPEGEPWVFMAEDVRISFNVYAVLFGRERLGRVVLHRPQLFLRTGAAGVAVPGGASAPAAIPVRPPSDPVLVPVPASPSGPAAVAARLRAFLRPPFPLRVLNVTDGRVELVGPAGERTVAAGVDISLLVSRGGAGAMVKVKSLQHERAGRSIDVGRVEADLRLEDELVRLHKLVVAGGPVTGTVRGTVGYAGALALNGGVTAGLEQIAALAGRPGAVGGSARFEAEIGGSWQNPAGSGSVVVKNLAAGGRRWPELRGRVGWASGAIVWSGLRLPVGAGSVTSSGEIEISRGPLRYRVDAEAADLDLASLPGAPRGFASGVRGLAGTLHWQGAGTGRDATGSGRFDARFSHALRPGENVDLAAAARLESGRLTVQSLGAESRSLKVAASGSWSPESGFAGRISGTVEDLQRLLPEAAVRLGGRGSFEGEITTDAAGPRITGAVQLANGVVGALSGIDANASVEAAPGGVRFVDSDVSWPGGRARVTGSIEIPTGRLDLSGVLGEWSLADAARLFGVDPGLVGGALEGRVRVRGTAAAPEIEGRFSGTALRYRAVLADTLALSVNYAAQRLEVGSLSLRRGSSQVTFHGELGPGRDLEGEFASPSFALADFAPAAGFELSGSLRGRVSGPLGDPVVVGTVSAGRLRAAGFDLRGGELTLEYRRGAAAVEGWIVAPENRLRIVVEPARNWRFVSDLELRQFAPGMVRSGFAGLPPALSRVLGKTTFMATGRLEAGGHLGDPGSMRGDLRLDTLWVHAAGQSLQNRAPVRITWHEGSLAVEDFQVSGEQYHFEISGGGGIEDGWNLKAAGVVNLAVFKEYWRDLDEAEGVGDLQLTLGGPWSAPRPEGSLVVHKALVRARPLPERLENLEGRLELRGRTLTARQLSGTIGDGEFRGGGTYDFEQDRIDAEIDGRLDLSLFRGRLPVARELRGPVQARLHLTGPLAAPVFSGQVDVLDAEMFLRPFPAKITHLRGKVVVEADRLEVSNLDGRTGGGSVHLSGTMDWARAPIRVDAELEARGVLVSLAGALKAQSDLRLELHGDFVDLKLSGEVRILKARYLREFNERFPRLVPSAGPAAVTGPGSTVAQPRVALDVKIVAPDNVWITNKVARIETAVALQIGGRLDAPTVSGEIVGIQGEAIYFSRQLRLESGTLRFVPPALIPVLDVQASTTVGETQIFLLLEGPLNRLSYHLTSLPPMSQQDLFVLATIGETRSSLETKGGDRASSAGAAAFSAEPLVNALGNEVRNTTGLEVLQLEPVVGDNNQVSARVTLGTHLSDRMYVSYSQNLGATEDQQVAVQYSLLDYVSIWGQELRQGVYSLDLVFRYTFQ